MSNLLMSKDYVCLFPTIMKESIKVVKSLINLSQQGKAHKFCLSKILEAIILAAEVNGYFKSESQRIEEFSVANLQDYLRIYKSLFKNFGGRISSSC